MLYRYKDLISKGLNDYQIKKLLKNKDLIKVEKTLYSNNFNYDKVDIVSKLYPMNVITLNSALFEYKLIKEKPSKVYIATKQKARKIKLSYVEQTFMSDHLLDVGIVHIKKNNSIINIFDLERLLIEIVRYRPIIDYKIYNEAMDNYKRIIKLLNQNKLNDYLKVFKDIQLNNKVNKIIKDI